ncbi:hypothetical protein GGR54DRAFT_283672 [Hypoxylon sp. NC1633]|nr:hypothetical protein GGR54DRAFT_283672 [Hypoxylon sp. NC1633]
MKRIRFLGDGGNCSGSKRRQVKRACDSCRRGKRRCSHGHIEASVHQGGDTDQVAITTPESSEDHNRLLDLNHRLPKPVSLGRPDSLENERISSSISPSGSVFPFIGPSSGHGLLLSACTKPIMKEVEAEMDATRHLPRSRALRPSFQDMRAPPSERRPGVAPGSFPMVVRAVLPYLEIECLQILPPQHDLDALIQIFRQEVHPILPIVDFSTPSLADPVNRDNPASITLRQAICLAACKNASARQHLQLPDSEGGQYSVKTPRDFADRLFGALKIALDIGLVDDRLELVQVLALMTFHSYGPDGDDEVARLCGQAVHYAYSAGIHYPSRSNGRISEERRVELLCSLFALDKIIATITGRPAIIRSSDIYLPAQDDVAMKALSPGLRLLFRLCQMLDRVLDLYRAWPPEEMAQGKCVWEDSWLEFEDLAKDCNIRTLQPPLQACLEVLYHVIGVISYRPPQVSTLQNIPSESIASSILRSSRVRYKHCAQQISFLLGSETSKFPFIPYAASLSLTVALRNIQQTRLESTKRIAKEDVERNLGLLKELTETYWHAESASIVGRQILQSL